MWRLPELGGIAAEMLLLEVIAFLALMLCWGWLARAVFWLLGWEWGWL